MFRKSFKILSVSVLAIFLLSGTSVADFFMKKDGKEFNGKLATPSIKVTASSGKSINVDSAEVISIIRDESRGMRIKPEAQEAVWGEIVGNVKVKTAKGEIVLKPEDLIFYCSFEKPIKIGKLQIIEAMGGIIINVHQTRPKEIVILPEYWKEKVFTISNPQYPRVVEDSTKPVKLSFDFHRHLSTDYEATVTFRWVSPVKEGKLQGKRDKLSGIEVCKWDFPPISVLEGETKREEREIIFGELKGREHIEVFVTADHQQGPLVSKKLGDTQIKIYNTISNVIRLPLDFKR